MEYNWMKLPFMALQVGNAYFYRLLNKIIELSRSLW